ncbi:MAG: segregation/condensation protein A [Cyanobacteria bacterium]|nr:segregation/condensation protein A [Cyanobacteriota bacterium]
MAEAGARLAIRLLQDAAERGEIDPWDVDVIAVIDGFLDQLRQRIEAPRLASLHRGSYEQDLAESSEAFLAASVLVGLKAEVLEAATFPVEAIVQEAFAFDDPGEGWAAEGGFSLPARPERHLQRRLVAPPPLQRPVTLGELIRQLEDIAERLEADEGKVRQKHRPKRYSDRAAMAQVAALAHREKLPETTAALNRFLQTWSDSASCRWIGFDELVGAWGQAVDQASAQEELDQDRVGVFWALLFLCSQGKVELDQPGGLYAPLSLKRLLEPGEMVQLPLAVAPSTGAQGEGSAGGPALQPLAA